MCVNAKGEKSKRKLSQEAKICISLKEFSRCGCPSRLINSLQEETIVRRVLGTNAGGIEEKNPPCRQVGISRMVEVVYFQDQKKSLICKDRP